MAILENIINRFVLIHENHAIFYAFFTFIFYSAKNGKGVSELLEKVQFLAELLDLRADETGSAEAVWDEWCVDVECIDETGSVEAVWDEWYVDGEYIDETGSVEAVWDEWCVDVNVLMRRVLPKPYEMSDV